MKSSIHPQNYRPVVFSDDQAGFAFLTQSTAQSTDTIDTEGRVDRFKARQAAAEARKAALANKAKKAAAKKAAKAADDDTDDTKKKAAAPKVKTKKVKK